MTYSNVGIFEVELIVTLDGCSAYAYKTITITTSPTTCSQNLVIDTEVTNPEAGQIMVSWEMNANVPGGLVYHVEHSDDGENFSRVATVNTPTDTRNGIHYFEYYAQAPKRGLNYYRVQIEDTQSNTALSNVEEVVLYTDSKIAMLYPNPVEDVLTLEIFDTFGEEDVVLEVFSVSGKKVATVDVGADQRRLQLDVSTYPAGVYLLRLRIGKTDIRTMRVVKRK